MSDFTLISYSAFIIQLILVIIHPCLSSDSRHGELTLSEPSPKTKGSDVDLVCEFKPQATRSPRQLMMISTSSCTLRWFRTRHLGRHTFIDTALDNHHMHVDTKWNNNNHQRLLVSTLSIRHVNLIDRGRYKCSLTCHNTELQSANIFLEVKGSKFPTDTATEILMALSFILLFTMGLVIICIECLKIRCGVSICGAPPEEDDVTSQPPGSPLYSAPVSMDRSPCFETPTRYSYVVVTRQGSHGKESTVSNLLDPNDSRTVQSTLLVPTPPLEYSQALMNLAKQGFLFSTSDFTKLTTPQQCPQIKISNV